MADASFEKEVIGLFALEAHEWLAQIHSALKRLSEGSSGTTRSKLYGIMLQALSNLARSAATVHLSGIEDMALGLLPVLHDVGRHERLPYLAQHRAHVDHDAGALASEDRHHGAHRAP